MARTWAPALSRPAFKNIRPGGNYQKYLAYLGAHRQGWDPSRPYVAQKRKDSTGPIVTGPFSYNKLLDILRPSFQTPQQMEASANRMAQTQLAAQQAILNQTYARDQADAMRTMQAFQAAGRAAAAMNSSLIGQVGGQYQAGADALSNMASAGAAQMAQATQASVDAANAASANVGMPGVTVGGPVGAPGIAGSTQAGVESYRGGTLPAQMLQNAGGYAEAGMAGQIGAQNLRATQEAQAAYLEAIGKARDSRDTALQALVQGRPDIAQKYLLQLQDNQRQAIALASGLVGSGFQQGMTNKQWKNTVQQQGVKNAQWAATFAQSQKEFAAKMKLAAQQNAIDMGRIDASASRAWGYLVDKAGRPIKGKNGQPIPVASSGGRGGGGLTPYQVSRLMPKAQDLAEGAYYGYGFDARGHRVPVNQLPGFDPATSKVGQGTLNYGPARSRMLRMGLPPAAANQILNELYGRGEAGRPLVSPQEEKFIKQHGAKNYQRWMAVLKRAQAQLGPQEMDALVQEAMAGNTPPTLPSRAPTQTEKRGGGRPWWSRAWNTVTSAPGSGSFGQIGR